MCHVFKNQISTNANISKSIVGMQYYYVFIFCFLEVQVLYLKGAYNI